MRRGTIISMIAALTLVLAGCGSSGTVTQGTSRQSTSASASAGSNLRRDVTLGSASGYRVGEHPVVRALDGDVALVPGVYDVSNGAASGGVTVRRGPAGAGTAVFSQKLSSDSSALHVVPAVRLSLHKGDVVGVDDGARLKFVPVKDRGAAVAALASGTGTDIGPGLYDFGADLPVSRLTFNVAVKLVGDDGAYPNGEAGYQLFGVEKNGDVSGDGARYGFSEGQSLTLGSVPSSDQYLALYGASKFHVVRG